MNFTRRLAASVIITLGLPLFGARDAFAGTIAKPVPAVAAAAPSSRAKPGEPSKVTCANRMAAYIASLQYAANSGGTVTVTSGTPSMEPLIHGQVYAVTVKQAYNEISKRSILIYMGRPNANKPDRLKMLHRAVMHDDSGWIMRGDNNRWSESWDRVTPQTYVGTVVALFDYPQA